MGVRYSITTAHRPLANARGSRGSDAAKSPRTTKLYDRTKERLTQDEVERIRL
jgi:hypothetical protein